MSVLFIVAANKEQHGEGIEEFQKTFYIQAEIDRARKAAVDSRLQKVSPRSFKSQITKIKRYTVCIQNHKKLRKKKKERNIKEDENIYRDKFIDKKK